MRNQFHVQILVLVLTLALVFPSAANAWDGCGNQVTVQRGDTLYSIARQCGYTVDQILGYNPGLTSWIYPGQVIYLYSQQGQVDWPSYGSYYTVRYGDTLFKIANRFGVSMDSIANANNISAWSWIYAGQSLYIPSYGWQPDQTPSTPPIEPVPMVYQTYQIQRGDTLKSLASGWGISLWDLLKLNPQIGNANLIYVGQSINTPFAGWDEGGYYTVQPGDTMKKIASYYGISLSYLLSLNPTIWNPNLIYVGTVLRVQ